MYFWGDIPIAGGNIGTYPVRDGFSEFGVFDYVPHLSEGTVHSCKLSDRDLKNTPTAY